MVLALGWPTISWAAIYVLSEWVIRLVMLPIVVRRKTPRMALSWLLIIFLLPWLGLVVYLLVGENRLGRRRRRQREQVIQATQAVDRLSAQQAHVIRPEMLPLERQFVQIASNLGGMPTLGGNTIELVADTDQVIDRLIDDINHAEHHVHLLFYIYRDDEIGRKVADALRRAERRGVECRVLVDAVGSSRMMRRLGRDMRQANVDVFEMLPVSPIRRAFERLDLRNHRKLAVIDGRIGYTGSQNIVEASYGHKDLAWHDVMVRITGPTVLQLQVVFIEDWLARTDQLLDSQDILPEPQATGEVAVQVVPSGPAYATEPLLHLFVQAFHWAQKRLIITSPYLVPDEASLLALRLAVRRGVQVDLVTTQQSDHPIVAAAARAYFEDLLDAGVNLHLYKPGLLHAKTMTVDDAFAVVGSANFDIRSFFLNFELNVLLYGSQSTAQLRFLQQYYMDQADQITRRQWSGRPRTRRFVDDLAKLFSPLL